MDSIIEQNRQYFQQQNRFRKYVSLYRQVGGVKREEPPRKAYSTFLQ